MELYKIYFNVKSDITPFFNFCDKVLQVETATSWSHTVSITKSIGDTPPQPIKWKSLSLVHCDWEGDIRAFRTYIIEPITFILYLGVSIK